MFKKNLKERVKKVDFNNERLVAKKTSMTTLAAQRQITCLLEDGLRDTNFSEDWPSSAAAFWLDWLSELENKTVQLLRKFSHFMQNLKILGYCAYLLSGCIMEKESDRELTNGSNLT